MVGAQMLRTLAAAGILGCGVNVYYFFSIGTGQSSRIAKITVAHALLTVILTILAIHMYGPMAAGVGYLIANAIRLCATAWFASKYFSTVASLHKQIECTMPPLIAGLLVAWAWTQTNWLMPVGWAQLFVVYVPDGVHGSFHFNCCHFADWQWSATGQGDSAGFARYLDKRKLNYVWHRRHLCQ